MNEQQIKNIIENYDNNILILEELEKKKNTNRLRNGIFTEETFAQRVAKSEYDAETFMLEITNYLKHYTKTKMKAQKELDFIRKQADKLGFRFQPIASSYAYEFYPAAQDAGLNQKTIHNLLIGISEFAAAQNASSEMLSELLSEIADLLQYGTTPNDVSLKTSEMNINKEIQELVQRGGANKKFYENFAGLLHFKYGNSAIENIDQEIANRNRMANRVFDHNVNLKGISNLLIGSLSISSAISSIVGIFTKPKTYLKRFLGNRILQILLGLGISSYLLDKYTSNETRNKRYDNGNFTFDKFQADENIFTPEEQDKIYGRIEMFRPYSNLQWKQGPPEGAIQLEYDTNLNYKLNYNNENQSPLISTITEQTSFSEIENESEDTNKTKYPDTFENDVKEIVANVFDDFAQLKGFKKRV